VNEHRVGVALLLPFLLQRAGVATRIVAMAGPTAFSTPCRDLAPLLFGTSSLPLFCFGVVTPWDQQDCLN